MSSPYWPKWIFNFPEKRDCKNRLTIENVLCAVCCVLCAVCCVLCAVCCGHGTNQRWDAIHQQRWIETSLSCLLPLSQKRSFSWHYGTMLINRTFWGGSCSSTRSKIKVKRTNELARFWTEFPVTCVSRWSAADPPLKSSPNPSIRADSVDVNVMVLKSYKNSSL